MNPQIYIEFYTPGYLTLLTNGIPFLPQVLTAYVITAPAYLAFVDMVPLHES